MAKEDKSCKSCVAPHFEESPFSNPTMVTIYLRNAKPLKVHESVIAPYPFLKNALIPPTIYSKLPPGGGVSSTYFDSHSDTAGHILIQYLYSNTYSPKRWTGPSIPYATLFKDSMAVFGTAYALGMTHLASLAMDEAERTSDKLDASTVLRKIAECHWYLSGDNEWVNDFTEGIVKRAFSELINDDGGRLDDDDDREYWPLGSMVIQSVFDVFQEKVKGLRGSRGKHPLIVVGKGQVMEREEENLREEGPSTPESPAFVSWEEKAKESPAP